DADGDGHLQRSDAHQLDRAIDALAIKTKGHKGYKGHEGHKRPALIIEQATADIRSVKRADVIERSTTGQTLTAVPLCPSYPLCSLVLFLHQPELEVSP